MKPFSEFDQAVPVPEIGKGLVLRFTNNDFVEVERWADVELAKVKQDNQLTILSAMSNWSWIGLSLTQRRLNAINFLLPIALKKADGITRAFAEGEALPAFGILPLGEKLEVAFIAALEGVTIEVLRKRWDEEREKLIGEPENPRNAQVEAS